MPECGIVRAAHKSQPGTICIILTERFAEPRLGAYAGGMQVEASFGISPAEQRGAYPGTAGLISSCHLIGGWNKRDILMLPISHTGADGLPTPEQFNRVFGAHHERYSE